MSTSTWPWMRQPPLTPLERANSQWALAADPQESQQSVDRSGAEELRRQFQPQQRPPVQPTGTQEWLEPLGEFPLVSVSVDDRMYVDGYVGIAAKRLGVDSPFVEFYRAPAWANRGVHSSAHPGVIFVRVGQTMAHILATALHETAHHAGVDDENDAEQFAQFQLRDSIYGPDARLGVTDDPLFERWARCLRERGIQA